MTYRYQDASTLELAQDAAHALAELQTRIRAGEGPRRLTQSQREALTRTRALLGDWAEQATR